MAKGGADEVLVSRPVKDLVVDSGVKFKDGGAVSSTACREMALISGTLGFTSGASGQPDERAGAESIWAHVATRDLSKRGRSTLGESRRADAFSVAMDERYFCNLCQPNRLRLPAFAPTSATLKTLWDGPPRCLW